MDRNFGSINSNNYRWNNSNTNFTFYADGGSLTVSNGGLVTYNDYYLGAGVAATVTVTGAHSQFNSGENGTDYNYVGESSNGTLNINDLTRAAQLVRDLKKTHDIVMVSFHGGGEGWTYVHVKPGAETFVGENRGDARAFAHAAIDAGASIVRCSGATAEDRFSLPIRETRSSRRLLANRPGGLNHA